MPSAAVKLPSEPPPTAHSPRDKGIWAASDLARLEQRGADGCAPAGSARNLREFRRGRRGVWVLKRAVVFPACAFRRCGWREIEYGAGMFSNHVGAVPPSIMSALTVVPRRGLFHFITRDNWWHNSWMALIPSSGANPAWEARPCTMISASPTPLRAVFSRPEGRRKAPGRTPRRCDGLRFRSACGRTRCRFLHRRSREKRCVWWERSLVFEGS